MEKPRQAGSLGLLASILAYLVRSWPGKTLAQKSRKVTLKLPSGPHMSVYTNAHIHTHTTGILLTHLYTQNRDENKEVISLI